MQLPGLAHTHCCSACFSTPSADTAWEKEDESFGLGPMQENPTKTSPCWSTISYSVFLSQLEMALNSLGKSIGLRLP